MEEIINNYKTWLIANNKSENTQTCYVLEIKTFLAKTGIQNLSDLNETIVNKYFADLKPTVEQATYNHHVYALASFLDFNNIHIRLPKTKTPMLKEEDIIDELVFENEIIDTLDLHFSNGLKIKAILSFFYYAGIRKNELITIKREHINLEKNLITVINVKQNIQHNLELSAQLKPILERYFISESESINAFNITKVGLKTLMKNLRFYYPDLKLHWHKFRHSWATNAYRMGMKLEHIQHIMQHKSILTTMRYVQLAKNEEVRGIFRKLEAEQIKKLRKEIKEKNDEKS